MNKELIEKLKKDSQMICGYTDGGYTPLYALDTEKFTELIVNECYNAVNEALYHDYVFDNHTPAEIRKTALRAVKGCFGIE